VLLQGTVLKLVHEIGFKWLYQISQHANVYCFTNFDVQWRS